MIHSLPLVVHMFIKGKRLESAKNETAHINGKISRINKPPPQYGGKSYLFF